MYAYRHVYNSVYNGSDYEPMYRCLILTLDSPANSIEYCFLWKCTTVCILTTLKYRVLIHQFSKKNLIFPKNILSWDSDDEVVNHLSSNLDIDLVKAVPGLVSIMAQVYPNLFQTYMLMILVAESPRWRGFQRPPESFVCISTVFSLLSICMFVQWCKTRILTTPLLKVQNDQPKEVREGEKRFHQCRIKSDHFLLTISK